MLFRSLFCCIVRDPRDQLCSLIEFDGHPELPRGIKFWRHWAKQYDGYLKFAQQHRLARCFLIRYEDMVRFPVQAKSEFLEWLGLSIDTYPITTKLTVRHQNDDQDPQIKIAKEITSKTMGRHRNPKNSDHSPLINAYLRFPAAVKLMARFGYGATHLSTMEDLGIPNLHVFIQPDTENETVGHRVEGSE